MKTLFKTCCAFTFLFAAQTYSQEKKPQDSTQAKLLDEVLVASVRANSKQPVSFTNMSKKELNERNLGQDIPILMNYLPSVVTTTDAGNGVGYTGIRVRGSDATRVNVTINGIAYNDSESHGTYWVNMPDFVSSTENLQLQRGVGTSTNGAGAFGASLNLLTDSYSEKSNGEISNSFGSFNTHKHTVKFSTGLMNEHFEMAGRLSQIKSDGYIDRAFSNLKSYFLQGTYVNESTLIKALVFGGAEKTYQAWNGIDAATLESDRTFNPSGMFTDEFGNVRFYNNETDNYQQDHAQLHWNQKIGNEWNANVAFHYTKGKGYYENYKEDQDFFEYGMIPVLGQTSTDLIAQKWLDNDYYGTTFSLNYRKDKIDLIFGGAWNKYDGDHFGKVIWARYASMSELGDRYYDDYGVKTDGNIFAKVNVELFKGLLFYGDLQFRKVNYKATGVQANVIDDAFGFFNPKAGLTYIVNPKNSLYFSFARANREPNRTDYENGNPKPEKLNDFELGWRYGSAKAKFNANVYYMGYKDQLVLTGELDDVGAPIRANSGDSYRLGLELDAAVVLMDKLSIHPNATISVNKNKDFVFQRNGQLEHLGSTNIAYSPNFIAGNALVFIPVKNLQFSFLSKLVGDQYMGNIDSEVSKLKGYFVNDFSVNWEIKPKSVFKSIHFSGLVNNVFDYKYVSNGYFYTYDDDWSNPGSVATVEGAGYYPQAGINFLIGMTLKF